ncbi:uncharacterized protein LOC109815899 [Cajanus cajan]|uniref:uncharacterized protein LOC109815899 n=1 Tax=Cajanus cajan TaxID=3821 RepID=UPI00098DB334|nr:uncharacterized protein LOC109815899 [Cajanus cajan]
MAPLVKVLRLVDGEKKRAMGYMYEAMDKAKEVIMKSFNNNETKYKAVFDIVDRRWDVQLHHPLHVAGHFLNLEMFYDNPQMEFDRELFGIELAITMRKKVSLAQWWRLYGSSTPNLQQLAIKISSLTCSSSGCARNWNVFEQRRNRLENKKLHDLVYVKYIQALMRRYNLKDEIDPISLNDIDEWVGEPLMYTRHNKRKQPPSGEGASSQKVSKKGKGVSSSTRKGKGKVAKVVEGDSEDISEELEEELPNINFDNSEGEEVEGYAPLAFNEKNDYIEEEEENDDEEEDD